MAKVSKRTIKAIQVASVFDSILRERFTSTLTPYFADHNPETWTGEQKEIFNIASEIEHQFREEILKILTEE